MALVSGGRSSLNPNAQLFVPAAVRQVEDFSPEWWQLVTTSTCIDLAADEELISMEAQYEQFIQSSEAGNKSSMYAQNGMPAIGTEHAGLMRSLSMVNSYQERSPRDPVLVKKIGAATALEARATGNPYVFAPCIAVCRDPRWGHCSGND
ncbi:hypothetical protein POM88_004117 [Heracleum sosnowskyi]|uniref:Uncharacterized protein n=1 Tax=Heracleum sosnowskyi TaxID=360622 RepID=A0AAD8JHE1_9APIA|nr:hypothetical protein POM88_004117 [Heracleum sosnowskyi]